MRDLGAELRAITDAPPPTAIDVDTLIEREQRRARVLRVGSAAGGVAAAVTALLLGVGLLTGWLNWDTGESSAAAGSTTSGDQRPRPGGGSPEPTADVASGAPIPCGVVLLAPKGAYQSFTAVRRDAIKAPADTARRMSSVFNTAIEGYLPGAKVTDLTHEKGCAGQPQLVYDPQRREFSMELRIDDASGWGMISITVRPTIKGWDPCEWVQGDTSCAVKKLPDGSSYWRGPSPNTNNPAAVSHGIEVYRTDGTTVGLGTSNYQTKPGLPQKPTVSPSTRQLPADVIITRPTSPLNAEHLLEIGTRAGLGIF